MKMLHFFLAFNPSHKGILEPPTQGPWTIQCKSRHNIIFTTRVNFPQRGTHTWTFDLEAANGSTTLDPLSRGRVIWGSGFQNGQCSLKVIRLTLLNEFSNIAQHGKSTNAKQVDLHQTQCLD